MQNQDFGAVDQETVGIRLPDTDFAARNTLKHYFKHGKKSCWQNNLRLQKTGEKSSYMTQVKTEITQQNLVKLLVDTFDIFIL